MVNINDEYEDHRTQKIDFAILKSLLPRFRAHLRSLFSCGLLLAVSSLLSLAGPLLVRHAIDNNFTEHDLHGLFVTAGLFLLTLILSFIVNYLQQIKLEIVGQKIVKKIRIEIFSHITRLSQSFFDKNPVGKIVSRIESDTEALRTMFTYTVITILSDLLMMIGMFVVMFNLSPRLTSLLLSVFPFVILIVRYFNSRIIPIFIEVRRRTAEVYGFLEEYIRGAKIVQVFDQESNVIHRMDRVNKNKVDVEYPGERLSNYFGHSVFLLSTIATALILGFGGKWVLDAPELLSLGTLVAFLGYIQRFFGPIFHLSEQINVIQRALAGIQRINEIMCIPQQGIQEIASPMDGYSTRNKPDGSGIEFRHVWFAYQGEEWILKDVSFTIPKGDKVAIVGPTGSGKTTIISLLFRFYEPQKGTITIDGVDIRTIPLDTLRRKLGLVLQDIVLFPGSILDNLRLEDDRISEESVMRAIQTVNAKDIVDRLPDGIMCPLAEHGSNLSMGERQLLSFARALVFDPEILVLDEATSSVDPITEHRIQCAMDTLLKGRTAVIIAHRLQTILESDRILVLQEGELVEQGSHSDLMQQHGVYFKLYSIQYGNGKAA